MNLSTVGISSYFFESAVQGAFVSRCEFSTPVCLFNGLVGVSCFCALRVRAAPSRLLAPPDDPQAIVAGVAHFLAWSVVFRLPPFSWCGHENTAETLVPPLSLPNSMPFTGFYSAGSHGESAGKPRMLEVRRRALPRSSQAAWPHDPCRGAQAVAAFNKCLSRPPKKCQQECQQTSAVES